MYSENDLLKSSNCITKTWVSERHALKTAFPFRLPLASVSWNGGRRGEGTRLEVIYQSLATSGIKTPKQNF